MKLAHKKPAITVGADLSIPVDSFTSSQIEALKDSLTFDNPKYTSAKKFSRYGVTSIPPYISYYYSECGFLHVPLGSDLSLLNNPRIVDKRVSRVCSTPEFALTLRPDQQAAAEEYLTRNSGISMCGAIQLPTGKGKTILALYIAATLKQRTLVLVHKDDLVTGWKEDINLAFSGKCKPGLIKAASRTVGDFVTIATVQTLSRMSKEKRDKFTDKFGFVILDEMHHCPATTFSVVGEFNSRYKLGLTATPERKDGLAFVMNLYFGDFCYRYKVTESEKDILPVEVIRRTMSELYVTPVCKKKNGKWTIKEYVDKRTYTLEDGERLITDIPYSDRPKIVYSDFSDFVSRSFWEELSQDVQAEFYQGHSCLVFFSQKAQVDDFVDVLTSSGVPEDSVIKYYGTRNKANEANKRKAENTRQLVTVATFKKATEGTNVPQWEVAFFGSSLNSGKDVEQAIGRIRRTTNKDKLDVVRVYDYQCPYVYSISLHSKTRNERYVKLGCLLDGVHREEKKPLLTRGYRR